MDNVRIAPTDSDPVNFPCACWLAEDVWDSKTERELLPGKAVKRPESMCFGQAFTCFMSWHRLAELRNLCSFLQYVWAHGPCTASIALVPNVLMLKSGI